MSNASFELIEFNGRRLARGADAARVNCELDGWQTWLWMSRKDVEANIREFGEHPELLRAREAYRIGQMPPIEPLSANVGNEGRDSVPLD